MSDPQAAPRGAACFHSGRFGLSCRDPGLASERISARLGPMAFFPVAILIVFLLMYLLRSRRTRLCRWRRRGDTDWRCAACGAVTQTRDGKQPRLCLRETS